MQTQTYYFCLVKQFIVFCFSLGYCLFLNAQNKQKQATWQQQTDYKITVELNPMQKMLYGHIRLTYSNNSPDTLRNLWLHAWPNAYKNTQTPYALQLLKNNKIDFQFSEEADKGWIDSFKFTANDSPLKWQFDSLSNELINIQLDEPLLPGKKITLETPFVEKLPKLFSRGGVYKSFFAITQWYPKPAVYDVNGWNTMPYLEQGEFYSEFGNFDVEITLPEKYLVAATGNLVTQSELAILNTLISENNGQNNSHSNTLKTLVFHENNIHDFAWFADTTFKINKDQTTLKNGEVVQTWVFESLGNRLAHRKEISAIPVSKAVKAYSDKIGEYPYKNCTLVIGSIIAGGGMEYPTITVCDDDDVETTMHEVGHNWFYGMLGTNERTYPWMDESINTFFEQKFSDKLQGDGNFYKKFKAKAWSTNYETLLAYLFSARQGISQPLNLPSEAFSDLNYGSIVYAKGPLLFAYLEQQLGDSLFEHCFRNYFKTWQYKHPLPGDMKASFEQTTGLNLDWFFIDLLNENNSIDLKSKYSQLYLEGSLGLDSFLKSKNYTGANSFGFLPETNYQNNGQQKHLVSLHIPFYTPTYNSRISTNLCPIVGYNLYDQLYAGAVIFNRSLFRKKYEYTLMPAYAFGSKSMVGYGKINGLFFPQSNVIQKIETGVQGQSFGMRYLSHENQYYRINPYLRIYLKPHHKLNEQYEKLLQLNFYNTGLRDKTYSYDDSTINRFPEYYFFNYINLSYRYENKHPINSFSYQLNAEGGSNYKFGPNQNQYIKTWVNAEYKYQYAKKKFFKTTFFAGLFLYEKGNVSSQQFFLFGNNGSRDYLFNQALLGRSESNSSNTIFNRQIISTNGNMRNILPSAAAHKWMISCNNEISLPGALPLRIYLDAGVFKYNFITSTSNTNITRPELYATGGFIINAFKETLQIFIPLVQTKQLKKTASDLNYNFIDLIGFKLNLNKLEPTKLVDNFRP